MDALTYMEPCTGFLFAAYAVIANDSVQTLGTWMASNNERFNYKALWGLRQVQYYLQPCGMVGE